MHLNHPTTNNEHIYENNRVILEKEINQIVIGSKTIRKTLFLTARAYKRVCRHIFHLIRKSMDSMSEFVFVCMFVCGWMCEYVAVNLRLFRSHYCDIIYQHIPSIPFIFSVEEKKKQKLNDDM